MVDSGTLWLVLLVWIAVAAIGLGLLYAVVRAAVLSAMLEHTKRTVQAVSVVSSNTLAVRVEQP